MSDKQRIEGDMTCGAGFLVLPECLDQSYESRAGCFPMTVRLPRLDQRQDAHNLLAPFSQFRTEQDAGDAAEARYPGDSEWGCLQSWDDPDNWENTVIPTSAVVERLRFVTEGAADDDDQFHHTRDHIRWDQADWWSRLADWIGVLSSQDLIEFGKQRRIRRSFEQASMWIADPKCGQEPGFASLHIPDIRPYSGEPLTKEQLTRCMTLTGEAKRPPEAWLMLRDARSLLRSAEYRRAVLDAGTAAELALTSMLDTYLSVNSSPHVAEALMDDTKMLGRLCKIVKKLLPGALPDKFQARVIDPRNDAAHGVKEITKDVAETAIATTTELLNTAHPLSDFGLPPSQSTTPTA
jgi:hypothetical protein